MRCSDCLLMAVCQCLGSVAVPEQQCHTTEAMLHVYAGPGEPPDRYVFVMPSLCMYVPLRPGLLMRYNASRIYHGTWHDFDDRPPPIAAAAASSMCMVRPLLCNAACVICCKCHRQTV